MADFLMDFAAGLVSKTIAAAVTFPLERAVTLLKVEGANPGLGAPAKPYARGLFGFVDVIRQTNGSLGWRANYNGVSMAIVAPAITTPLTFALKDSVKRCFPKINPKTDFLTFTAVNFASGAVAGAVALPVNLATSWPIMRAQADLRPQGTRLDGFGHFTHMWGSTASATSLSLMARAVPFSIVGIVVYRGAYFGVHDTMVGLNPFKKDKGLVGLASKFATAQLSALFSTFLNYPFCVVVDRFVVANWHDPAHAPPPITTLRECASAAMEGRGIGGLWRGSPSKITTSVASGLVLLAYGEIKSALS